MTGRRKGTPCACEMDPCSCGSSKGKCIRTINNLSPDPNGDFFIEAGSGITITQTGDNSFEVSFDGTLPSNPVIYKGTVGSGGTVAILPAADPDNIGWMYIAIEAATSPVTYEVGDTLISDGYTWQVIPSGDDPVDWSQILNTPTTLAGYGITDALQVDNTPGTWVYSHYGVYQGLTAVSGTATATSLVFRDNDGCAQTKDPLSDSDSNYIVNVRTLNRRLTDGSVSKIGTVNVGSDTKPIKLVAGVPTPVTNDLMDVASTQRIQGEKNYDTSKLGEKDNGVAVFSTIPASHRQNVLLKAIDSNNDWFAREEHWAYSGGSSVYNRAVRKQISGVTYTNEFKQNIAADGTTYLTGPSRTYNASNTTDIVNIALLDAYTPMVRLTNNQTISGVKTFTSYLDRYDASSTNSVFGVMKMGNLNRSSLTSLRDFRLIRLLDVNDLEVLRLQYRKFNNTNALYVVFTDSQGTEHSVTIAAYSE